MVIRHHAASHGGETALAFEDDGIAFGSQDASQDGGTAIAFRGFGSLVATRPRRRPGGQSRRCNRPRFVLGGLRAKTGHQHNRPRVQASFEPRSEPPMQLSPEILEQVTRRIVKAVHPDRILLFGSHVWGLPTEDSDIDLLIIVPHSDQPAYRRARDVYKSLRGLPLPIEVVVRTRDEIAQANRVATSLERKVLTEGRALPG